ncbi:aryl-acylamidase, partial [Aphelenchoides avenae]
CRIYVPEASHLKSKGLIVFVHGGGWCVLCPSHYDGAVYATIKRAGVVAISIDYRRAPEALFPAAIDDCEAVVKAIFEDEYKRLGVDRHRIAVMGESAGGNLATVVCQRLLRQKESYVHCQILVNPVIHALDFLSPSYQEYYRVYSDSALLSPSLLAMWYLLYLGIEPTRKDIRSVTENRHISTELRSSQAIQSLVDVSHLPATITSKHHYQRIPSSEPDEELAERFSKLTTPDLCPLLGKDLYGLPPAFIATMETDIVRDEGIFYAKRLRSFNVPTVWKHYDTGYHGMLQMPGSKLREKLLDD